MNISIWCQPSTRPEFPIYSELATELRAYRSGTTLCVSDIRLRDASVGDVTCGLATQKLVVFVAPTADSYVFLITVLGKSLP
jgi:hypothetical protein